MYTKQQGWFRNRMSPTSVLEFSAREPIHEDTNTSRGLFDYNSPRLQGGGAPFPSEDHRVEVASSLNRTETPSPQVSRHPSNSNYAPHNNPPSNRSNGNNLTDSNNNHPTPQNLRDNPERLAKIKTELCHYWQNSNVCPWGTNCNYAHGEHELKFRYSTLLLMESSGQIPNAFTYLARPCSTWVTTGAW